MRSRYRIDAFQETYFVIDSLPAALRRDTARLHAALPRARPSPGTAGERHPPRGPVGPARGQGGARPLIVLPFRFSRNPSGRGGSSMLAIVALAALALPQPEPAAAQTVPMTVEVRTAAKADARAQAWAKELREALDLRKDEFRPVKPGESAELAVRIDSVIDGVGGAHVMQGALVMGKSSRPFNLSYPGEAGPQAEKLARNLRKYADQMKTAPAGH